MLQFLHQWICLESLVEEFHNTLLATAIIGLSVSEPHLVELLDEIYYTIAYTYRMLCRKSVAAWVMHETTLEQCRQGTRERKRMAAKSVDE